MMITCSGSPQGLTREGIAHEGLATKFRLVNRFRATHGLMQDRNFNHLHHGAIDINSSQNSKLADDTFLTNRKPSAPRQQVRRHWHELLTRLSTDSVDNAHLL